MAITIKDNEIDEELEKIVDDLRNRFGLKNVTKTDALRHILKIRHQGKKTHPNWLKLLY